MLEKVRNLFLYAGVDYPSFQRIKKTIQKNNRVLTIILSSVGAALIAVMLIFSFKSDNLSQNREVYGFGMMISIIILILSVTVAKKHLWMVTPLVYCTCSIYYLYGILIGAITDPTQKTVTFMVMLVFLPTFFIDRPISVIILSAIYIVIFEILCFSNKVGAVLSNDAVDAVVFGILGAVTGVIINQMKIKGYVLESKLREISKIDQLTQMKNRNAYELELDSIPDKCKYFLACVYIDANGLHEINNSKGHEYGDNMLKHIAIEIKSVFSDKNSYRTGGDEFVAFVPDKEKEEIEQMLSGLVEKIQSEGYAVAIGYEVAKVKHLSMDELIKSAEWKMFQDKKEYYKNIARNARN